MKGKLEEFQEFYRSMFDMTQNGSVNRNREDLALRDNLLRELLEDRSVGNHIKTKIRDRMGWKP